jgi:hypothetical protein
VHLKNHLPILATLLVFGWLVVDRAFMRPPAAIADEYHARIRESAEALPRHFGPWLAMDVPVPTAAVELLQPNVIISRRYTNIQTGEAVTFLFVQVRDARDILGHYPPACYPGQGWNTETADPVVWLEQGAQINGTRYRFVRDRLQEDSQIVIDNFLLLPDGTTCSDMDAVESVAQDRLRKVFGAAQVQLVYSVRVSPDRQRQITEEFISHIEPMIMAASAGESYVTQH